MPQENNFSSIYFCILPTISNSACSVEHCLLEWTQNFMLDDKIINFSKILLMLERREIGL